MLAVGCRAAAQEKKEAIARLKQELENIKERAQQIHMEKERKVGHTEGCIGSLIVHFARSAVSRVTL